MSAPRSARALAPAKVNLRLEVLGRRPDGFHELDTQLLALDLCDEVEVALAEGGGVRLELDGPQAGDDVPRDATNLAARAAAAVLERARATGAAGPDAGLAVRLTKRIPSQAGLGGGSSDAAAAALAAAAVLGLSREQEGDRLVERVAGLGSDCAFFLAAAATGHARCRGRGERVEPLPAFPSDRHVVVVTPAERASTAAVYAALAPTGRGASQERNDLEPAALRAVPGLGLWREVLDAAGCGHYTLAGSGSSFFGLHTDPAEAGAALARILSGAASRGLALRGSWLARPAGHGARLLPPG